MKEILLVLAISLAVCSCAANGRPDKGLISISKCGETTKAKTTTDLKYGKVEEEIKMKWKSWVGENSEFRIRLKPKSGNKDRLVTIKGVSGTLPGGASTPFAWLDGNGRANSLPDKTLVFCVPKDIPMETSYKFDVTVEDIGTLDPRVDVKF